MALNPDGPKPETVLGPLGFSYREDGSQPSSFAVTREHVRHAVSRERFVTYVNAYPLCYTPEVNTK